MPKKAENLIDAFNIFRPRPLNTDEMEFYQPTAKVREGSSFEYYESLYENIAVANTNVHFLVVGHAGCGKSTEFMMLGEKLRKIDMQPIFIKIDDDLNLTNFTYIDIYILLIKRLTEYVKNNDIKINLHIVESFEKSLMTKTTELYWDTKALAEAEAGASIKFLTFFKAAGKIASAFKTGMSKELRLELKPMMNDITETVNAFLRELNKCGTIIIIVDGLEKAVKDCVKKLLIDDGAALRAIDTHLVVACPLSLYRSEDATTLQSNFSLTNVLPMIKTHNRDAELSPFATGIDYIKELILRRACGSLFEDGVLEKIIYMGGGNLRDTFLLLENSAHYARMHKKDLIDEDVYKYVINKYAVEFFLRAHNRYYLRIKEIYNGDHSLTHEGELNDLKYAGVVFEYNGDRWIDLHPLVRYYIKRNIEKTPGMLG